MLRNHSVWMCGICFVIRNLTYVQVRWSKGLVWTRRYRYGVWVVPPYSDEDAARTSGATHEQVQGCHLGCLTWSEKQDMVPRPMDRDNAARYSPTVQPYACGAPCASILVLLCQHLSYRMHAATHEPSGKAPWLTAPMMGSWSPDVALFGSPPMDSENVARSLPQRNVGLRRRGGGSTGTRLEQGQQALHRNQCNG